MNKKLSFVFAMLLLTAAAVVGGCTITFESESSGSATDGGVFKSATSGNIWQQTVAIANVSGKPNLFNKESVLALAIDPQDHEALYAGTASGGLLYSYDAAASWGIARSLGKRRVQAVAVNAIDKCVVLAASDNRIMATNDCARNWDEVYFDNDRSMQITSIAFSPVAENIVFAGTSRGEVIISTNRGRSWAVLKRFDDARRRDDNALVRVAVSERNASIVWAATAGSGVYRSTDGGRSWQSFVEEFAEIHTRNGNTIRDIAVAPSDDRIVLVATGAGLVRTTDGGGHWRLMELIPPAESIAINAVAVFAGNPERIYYATDTSFGWTEDGGATWSSKKLPTTRLGAALAVDPDDPLTVYLGVHATVK